MINKWSTKKLWCVGCDADVDARLTDGREAYAHREDLHTLPFWVCDECKNFVGCHHKTNNRTRPLGCIPTPELKKARMKIHAVLDPVWQSAERKGATRQRLYAEIGEKIGKEYHTAKIRSIPEADEILQIVQSIVEGMKSEQATANIGAGRI